MRVADGAAWSSDTGAGLAHFHRLDNHWASSRYTHPSHRRRPPATATPAATAKDWDAIQAEYGRADDRHIDRLARMLGLPADALRAVGCGWCPRNRHWTMPERDGGGRIVGITRRWSDGRKRAVPGSRRGLTIPAGWSDRPGPVLLVEGASDTAALWAAGLAVIGRPSNTGGADLLADLLADHAERDIIVVGENDQKDNGRWPGRAGAAATAQGLADRLCRPVAWSLVPDGAKDSREWYRATGGTPDAVAALLGHLRDTATICQPAPVPTVEPYAEPTGDVVDLTTWRETMTDARVDSVGRPGLYLDRSPTGAGKSHADRAAMVKAGRSLTMLPDHDNCRELADSLRTDGHDAAAYPMLSGRTCQNHSEASAALAAGLSPSASVCLSCQYRSNCEYRLSMAEASGADHAIACHRRGALGMLDLAEGRPLVLVHEDAADLLRPMATITPDDLAGLLAVLRAARSAELDRAAEDRHPDVGLYAWLRDLADRCDHLIRAADAATTTCAVAMPGDPLRPPATWQRKLWSVLRADGRLNVSGDCLRAVVAWSAGELLSLAVQVDPADPRYPDAVARRSIVATWQTRFPSRAVVWFSDATADAQTLADLAGRPVEDRTPGGRLERLTATLQIPTDVTRRMAAGKVADLLRGILASRPDARRVGIIGHSNHVWQLRSGDTLGDATRGRISRWAYYGEGPDRASNGWLCCDLLICLGTPRVPPAAIRAELVRRGRVGAAADPASGRWGPRPWEGRTTSGETITVDGLGYADPLWAACHRDMVTAALVQAAGRGRAVLADGVPTVVLTTEPLGLPLVGSARGGRVSPMVQEVADLVQRHCTDSRKEYVLRESVQWNAIQTAQVAMLLGISPTTASDRLSAAAAAGLIVRAAARKGGWLPAGPSTDPDHAPAPDNADP
ncbi:MAG: hypothetical protein J5I93_02095, partial [Pirellulaceae bacterium]|nr:hypothetical protein [Pirellulaceae bacterium]